MTVYGDYTKARIGWFFGLTGWQLAVLVVAALPVLLAVRATAWGAMLAELVLWAVVAALTVMPVRGRSAVGWAVASTAAAVGGAAGWTRWRAAGTRGRIADLDTPDLPGVLTGVRVHEGGPQGPALARPALVANLADRTWAVTAQVVHPGVGMLDAEQRTRLGAGLAELLDLAARTELVDELLLLVRTVPEDGADRQQWLAGHRRPDGHRLSRLVNDGLADALTRASVRTEAFVTVVVRESRLARPAREAGGGLDGRARVLAGVMAEVEAQLRAGMGMTAVAWLTSPQLAAACRTGFAPADRAGLVAAQAAAARGEPVNADVPWAMAGPSGADTAVRHYRHDAWVSVSATVKLPVKGAVIGALAPVLTPSEPGERRSVLVAYPVVGLNAADRQSASAAWAADLGDELRSRAKVQQRTRARDEADLVRGLDRKLARGSSLTLPYAVATVTVPATASAAEFGRRLDASIRRAGFAPLRLDLAQDRAFAATAVPLGVSLTRRSDR
jgi:hypothetical protein